MWDARKIFPSNVVTSGHERQEDDSVKEKPESRQNLNLHKVLDQVATRAKDQNTVDKVLNVEKRDQQDADVVDNVNRIADTGIEPVDGKQGDSDAQENQ